MLKMVSIYEKINYRKNKDSDIFLRKTHSIRVKLYHFSLFSVKKKTEIAFMPSGERLNQTKRFDTHLSTDEISDTSSTRNSSSLLHDKLYEVRIHNSPKKDTADCVLASSIDVLIEFIPYLCFSKIQY